jgi:AbrB family looped-hinge helix DNA binding protein
MPSARLTTRRRITIPAAMRKAMGLKAGDKVEFVFDESGACHMVAAATRSALKEPGGKPAQQTST